MKCVRLRPSRITVFIFSVLLSGCCLTHNTVTNKTKVEPMSIQNIKFKTEAGGERIDDLFNQIYVESNFIRLKF